MEKSRTGGQSGIRWQKPWVLNKELEGHCGRHLFAGPVLSSNMRDLDWRLMRSF